MLTITDIAHIINVQINSDINGLPVRIFEGATRLDFCLSSVIYGIGQN